MTLGGRTIKALADAAVEVGADKFSDLPEKYKLKIADAFLFDSDELDIVAEEYKSLVELIRKEKLGG